MALTHEDVRNILKLIDESRFDSMDLEIGELKLRVRKSGGDISDLVGETPTRPARPAAAAIEQPPAELEFEGMSVISSPMVGTFYRAASPGERPFVEVGDKVDTGDTVGLVEVMKLFNSITAPCAGTVARILVENGKLVEYGQTLLLIEPAAV